MYESFYISISLPRITDILSLYSSVD